MKCIVLLDMRTRATTDRTARLPSAASAAPVPDGRLRMRDLVRESGLPRETIHFYKLQGLLPPPIKTGRNTALYTHEHLERLRRIRELQERQFLPLKAIRAVLDDSAAQDFTPEQEDLVRRVRGTLAGWTSAQQRPTVPVADFVPGRVTRREMRELIGAGLITVHGSGGHAKVAEDDAVILECWAQFKEVGFGPEQGVAPAALRVHDHAMQELVKREARLAVAAYAGAHPEDVSRVIEQVGPVIGRLLGAMHRKHLREFLATVGSEESAPRG
jgi:DNA-binding transcriptional MerR regulator